MQTEVTGVPLRYFWRPPGRQQVLVDDWLLLLLPDVANLDFEHLLQVGGLLSA